MSLTLEFQENVAILTHDDGKRNVFSPDAIRDYNEALDEVDFSVCAHGRPVAIRVSESELERRFHRA